MQKKRTKRNDKIKQSQQQQYGQGNIDNYESRYDNAPKVSNIKLIPKSEAQKRYSNIINANTVIFCTGPAGTGKCIGRDELVNLYVSDEIYLKLKGLESDEL